MNDFSTVNPLAILDFGFRISDCGLTGSFQIQRSAFRVCGMVDGSRATFPNLEL
jgi:hypothetical protein